MKKCKIIVAMLVAGSAWCNADVTASFIIGQEGVSAPDSRVSIFTTEPLGSQSGATTTEIGSLSDGTVLDFVITNKGKTGMWLPTVGDANWSWSNGDALAELNSALALDVSASEVAALQSFGAWAGGSVSRLDLDFGANENVSDGDTVVLYSFISSYNNGISTGSVSVSGLTDVAMEFATNAGSGFSSYSESTSVASGYGLTLLKITGTLSDKDSAVGFLSNVGKNGFSLTGYSVTSSVPEPATFGLIAGLGALALVASRRRRKSA